MKYLFTLIFALTNVGAFAQYSIYHTFEVPNNYHSSNFYIDTVSNPNNIWQIGKPQKTVFTSAYSVPNAIVTDTLLPYPANDTSVFYLKLGGSYYALLSLSFYYRLDIDTLSTAKIEISGDKGLNWIDPITEDTTYMFYWVYGKPRLDTSTTGWQRFYLNMDAWSHAYPGGGHTFPHYRTSDSIFYRFTFTSGSDTVHHDGWMMDNFTSENTGRVGIGMLNGASSSVFPNPTNGTVYIHPGFTTTADDRIVVYNMTGQVVYTAIPTNGKAVNLPLPDGVYTLKYAGPGGVAIERVIVTNSDN